MLRGGLVKRAGSHRDGVCRCPDEPHNDGVRVSADPQAGVMATGNRPIAWLTSRFASAFALYQPRRR
jgi:hypothetical protein